MKTAAQHNDGQTGEHSFRPSKPTTRAEREELTEKRVANARMVSPRFNSMAQCEAVAFVPKEIQSAAKAAGSPAIDDHGRVTLYELLKWVFSTDKPKEEETNWKKFGEKYAALMKKVLYDKQTEKVVEKAEVSACCIQSQALMFGTLRQLANQSPPILKGKTEPEIKEYLDKQISELETKIEDAFKKLSSNEKEK